MTDDITLRSPAPDGLRDWVQPLFDAFSEEFSEPQFASEAPMHDVSRLINAFDGERRIGSAGSFAFRLTVPGGEVAASGITAVGVNPDQRRRGVLRRMMTWLLDDAQARSEPVAVLWASEGAIYQRFGFGFGTLQAGFDVDRSRVVFRTPLAPDDRVRVRMIDADEAFGLFPPIWEAIRQSTPGSLDRTELKWRNHQLADAEWMRGSDGVKYRAVLEVDGVPRGYVVYRVHNEWDARGPRGVILVMELVGLDPEAEQRLWQWVASMDLIATVKLRRGPTPHPMLSWVTEPRRLGLTLSDGLWLRIVDLPAALAARTYAGEGTLVLEVTDAQIESNAGRWQLTVPPHGAATVKRTTAEPDLSLDMAALACTYLGAQRFADLSAAGRVREGRPGALQAADMLFMPSITPFCNTLF
ncbi:MAG: GNAT family N-acetyltransferase [Candidatus Limnocylindrales bacterium]